MKALMMGLILTGFVSSTLAMDRAELDDRIRMLTAKFEALQAQPDKRVPAAVLRQAQGIILLDTTKAGFMFAFQGGDGVAMVKDNWGNWSPVAFLNKKEASFGFQAGGEQNFYAILLMDTNTTQQLTQSQINVGGEAGGTAGSNSGSVDGRFNPPKESIRVYADRAGFYGGMAFKGGTLSPANNDNAVYYGQSVSMRDILFDRRVQPTQAAFDLADKIKTYSK
ncbi:MAG TPA: lipid-binding SYLF domain-containing protein [Candidatus Saccharimonadales bacterium]|nr:lipid-binding SYLF domain-containing protein [Candidatus Saccharimonadales bacterium]